MLTKAEVFDFASSRYLWARRVPRCGRERTISTAGVSCTEFSNKVRAKPSTMWREQASQISPIYSRPIGWH